MILVFVKMNLRPDKRKELWQTIHSLVAQFKKEDGCVNTGFYQNAADDNEFFLLEEWENRKALDDHLRSVKFTILMGAKSLLSRPPEIMIHTISDSSVLEVGDHKR